MGPTAAAPWPLAAFLYFEPNSLLAAKVQKRKRQAKGRFIPLENQVQRREKNGNRCTKAKKPTERIVF
jgi:hypothetical protein